MCKGAHLEVGGDPMLHGPGPDFRSQHLPTLNFGHEARQLLQDDVSLHFSHRLNLAQDMQSASILNDWTSLVHMLLAGFDSRSNV